MVIGFFNQEESSEYAQLRKPENLRNVLIQMWVASSKTTKEGKYTVLTTQNEPFCILSDDGGGLASYRMHAAAASVTVQEDDDINKVEGQKAEGVISRVFSNNMPEISPNISNYSLPEYPHREFALRCRIRASLCVPIYYDEHMYSFPDGVLEFVSTCDDQLENFRLMCRFNTGFVFREIKMYLMGNRLYGYSILLSQDYIVEMEHLLTVVCQKFPLPLAQYYVIRDTNVGALGVMHQTSNIGFQKTTSWCKFRHACKQMGLKIDEGLVGKSYLSHKSFFCRDITELSITDYPLAHYASNCGSIACFTICLCSFTPRYRECVLEFFLPTQLMDSNYPHTFLNSLLETVKEHLPYYMVASGELLGQVLSVRVIKSSTCDQPEYIKIGHPQSSLPRHEGPENERDSFNQLPRSLHLLFKDGIVQDELVQDIEKSNSNINFHEKTALREISKRKPNTVADIGHVDELEEEPPVRFIKPQPQNTQPKRPEEIIEAERNTVDMDHSALKMTLEETITHKEPDVSAERVDEFEGDSPVEDVAYAVSDEDVSYALSNEEDMNLESISKHFGRPLIDAAMSFGVSRSTFKRICRGLGIKRWESGKRKMGNNIPFKLKEGFNDGKSSRRNFSYLGLAPVHETVVGHSSQDSSKMTVKATYVNATIRFELPDFSGIAELEENVIERLHLERKSFSIKYQDEEGDWILIACDKDVRECMEMTRSLKKTTMKLLIDLPINRSAL